MEFLNKKKRQTEYSPVQLVIPSVGGDIDLVVVLTFMDTNVLILMRLKPSYFGNRLLHLLVLTHEQTYRQLIKI